MAKPTAKSAAAPGSGIRVTSSKATRPLSPKTTDRAVPLNSSSTNRQALKNSPVGSPAPVPVWGS